MEGVVSVVLAVFVFYDIILPQVGVASVLFCYDLSPYVFLGFGAGLNILFSWWVWAIGLIWVSRVHLVRMQFRKLGNEIAHHPAAPVTLLMGLALQRRRRQLAESG